MMNVIEPFMPTLHHGLLAIVPLGPTNMNSNYRGYGRPDAIYTLHSVRSHEKCHACLVHLVAYFIEISSGKGSVKDT